MLTVEKCSLKKITVNIHNFTELLFRLHTYMHDQRYIFNKYKSTGGWTDHRTNRLSAGLRLI